MKLIDILSMIVFLMHNIIIYIYIVEQIKQESINVCSSGMVIFRMIRARFLRMEAYLRDLLVFVIGNLISITTHSSFCIVTN